MKEFQDLVTIAPWTFIFSICNLLILTLGVKKLLFKPVQEIMRKRKEQIEDSYVQAEKAQSEAQALKAECETRLSGAREEASQIVKTATDRATARSEELIGEARAEVAALKTKADAEIESERRKAASELKGDISELVVNLAGLVVAKEIDAGTHKNLIDDFISHAGDEQ